MHEVWASATKRYGVDVRITLELMPNITWIVLVSDATVARARTLTELLEVLAEPPAANVVR